MLGKAAGGFGGAQAARGFLHPDGVRRNLGLKYHRITGRVGLHEKQPWDPVPAYAQAFAHGADFVRCRRDQCRHLGGIMGRAPLIVAPYDAELFGHWWYEGPAFIEGVLRAALERDTAPEPDNFHDWVRWKMGAGVARHFMEPYNRKIWKCPDLREMGTSWIAGRVPDAPLADVLRASLGHTTQGYVHQSVFRYPLRGGFAAIHERIARPLAGRIRLNHRVRRIEALPGGPRGSRGWKVDGERFDHVVSTLPLHVLPEVLAALVADVAPPTLRGTAFGIFHGVTGAALLAASLIAGALWQWRGASACFLGGALFAALGLALLTLHQRQAASRKSA